ncbi:Uncharacterized protein APZ42_015536 [Daphnia magna]|uniref:Uncharacterized protein n=1 Tax=Daphnia magna TaxID=35525 RepID=A0A162NW12_9CRUS|nr:Uncharacterized protein APZ42_015536 [Daphnia magna]
MNCGKTPARHCAFNFNQELTAVKTNGKKVLLVCYQNALQTPTAHRRAES